MAAEGSDEGAGGGGPEFDAVVVGGAGDEVGGGGDGDVVDGFLVAEQAGEGFGGGVSLGKKGGGERPEVHCEVV